MIEQSKLEAAIHHYLVCGLIDYGFAPDIGTLQKNGYGRCDIDEERRRRSAPAGRLATNVGIRHPWRSRSPRARL